MKKEAAKIVAVGDENLGQDFFIMAFKKLNSCPPWNIVLVKFEVGIKLKCVIERYCPLQQNSLNLQYIEIQILSIQSSIHFYLLFSTSYALISTVINPQHELPNERMI